MDPSFLSWEDAHPGAIKITRVISSTDMLLSRIDGLPQTFGTRFDTGLGLGLAADLSKVISLYIFTIHCKLLNCTAPIIGVEIVFHQHSKFKIFKQAPQV